MNILRLVSVGLFLASGPAFADPAGASAGSPVPSSSSNPSLQETLSWMDYTYNPQMSSGSFGHGMKEIYDPSSSANMFSRVNEDFTYKGCQLVLHIHDDPSSTLVGVHATSTQTFDLRDIDPKSIDTRKFDSHQNGEECRDPDVVRTMHMNCDSAEITFNTRDKRPLITVEAQSEDPRDKSGAHGAVTKTMESTALFEVNNSDYAERFARAFIHAIDLCTKGQ